MTHPGARVASVPPPRVWRLYNRRGIAGSAVTFVWSVTLLVAVTFAFAVFGVVSISTQVQAGLGGGARRLPEGCDFSGAPLMVSERVAKN